VRRLFGRLRFDRRRCAKLLEALGGYQKVWDARGKTFRDKPLHSWHSHYADALRVLATAYREPQELRRGPVYAMSSTAGRGHDGLRRPGSASSRTSTW
jgi:hypothetical protein